MGADVKMRTTWLEDAAPASRCCRSRPRCRRCPVLLTAELRDLERLTDPAAGLPEHLRGVPACLHRYEPLLRETWEQQRQATGA